jgi:hypothetical protein
MFGDNTDGIGLVATSSATPGVALAGRDVLLVGAGGAAAGVLGPLLEARPRRVVVANRTLAKALALASARHAGACLRRRAGGRARWTRPRRLRRRHQRHRQPACPAPACRCRFSVLKPGALAYDMMYGPAAAGLPAAGRASTAPRAATAWACWWSRRPSLPASGAACARPRRRCWPNLLRRELARMKAVLRWIAAGAAGLARAAAVLRAAHRAMACVDPESTTFQRSEAWRIATDKDRLRWRQQWVPYTRRSPTT